MKILLVSSSSLGHINPSLALGQYLQKKQITYHYLGIKNQMEEKVIKENISLLAFPHSFKKMIKDFHLKKILTELQKCRKIIKQYDVIIGFGGFITFMVMVANMFERKPLFLHEQNIILGTSNKCAYLMAKKIFLSYPKPLFKGIYVGSPTSDELKRREFTYRYHPHVLFVFGSLGSTSLNQITLAYLSTQNDFKIKYTLIIKKEHLPKNLSLPSNVHLIHHLNLKEHLNDFDVIFSRAGASTLEEICINGNYLIVIPSPYVKHHHQEKNAAYFQKKGCLRLVLEKELTPRRIAQEIAFYQNNYQDVYLQYQNKKQIKNLHSSELILEEIKKYVKD